jgi:hypothetical protein
MSNTHFTSSDIRKANKHWKWLGGWVKSKRRTGELCYYHQNITKPVIMSANRKDTPTALKAAMHKLMRQPAANDPVF